MEFSMTDLMDKENARKIIINLEKIYDELKRQNDLKELELEMRKFWIDRKVSEWKQKYKML